MKINFIAFAPTSEERKAWSGTVYSIYKALERIENVEMSYKAVRPKLHFGMIGYQNSSIFGGF